jgi:hypothetical protein
LSFSVDAGASRLYLREQTRKGFVNVPCRWEIRAAPAADAMEHRRPAAPPAAAGAKPLP